MLNNRQKVRPRIQRAFISWLEQSRSRFITPIRISKRTKDFIELDFINSNLLFSATLTSWEINVSINWQGECWDLLVCFEAIPQLTSDGYVCSLCLPELCWPNARTTYANREQLWKDHLFEPFLEWVNNKLAISPWIEIGGGIQEGMTYANLLVLLPDKKDQSIHSINEYQILANPIYRITEEKLIS